MNSDFKPNLFLATFQKLYSSSYVFFLVENTNFLNKGVKNAQTILLLYFCMLEWSN